MRWQSILRTIQQFIVNVFLHSNIIGALDGVDNNGVEDGLTDEESMDSDEELDDELDEELDEEAKNLLQ